MSILYSNVAPLTLSDEDSNFLHAFRDECANANVIKIASGYASVASIRELNEIVHEHSNTIKEIKLVLGMYYREGIPERLYQEIMRVNNQWTDEGLGEIRIVIPFNFHGKLYMFYSEEKDALSVNNCYVGSHNLSATVITNNNEDQYELSSTISDDADLIELDDFINRLLQDDVSRRVDLIDDIRRIFNQGNRQRNRTWRNRANRDGLVIDDETEIRDGNNQLLTMEDAEQYPVYTHYFAHRIEGLEFHFPIKVPNNNDLTRYMGSNVNTCFAAGRDGEQTRNWYEMQITVNAEYRGVGWPEQDNDRNTNPNCFYLVTDDDNMFLAHTTSDGAKQLSAVGNDQILGRWFKERFVDAGFVLPFVNYDENGNPLNVITQEMLNELGIQNFVLYGTDQFIRVRPNQIRDSRGRRYSNYEEYIDARVWVLTVE